MSGNIINWFESAALDAPNLRSPQPCKRGIHCDYKLKDEASGELVRACCSGVHPGEEGTGRRLFPGRRLDDGREQPACVRLTGAAHGFYERRRLRLSWAEWCEKHAIPFTPALPGQPFEPVVRSPLGGKREHQNEKRRVEELQQRFSPSVEDTLSAWRDYEEDIRRCQPDGEAKGAAFKRPNSVDWRMMSKGFLGMPGGPEAALVSCRTAARSRVSDVIPPVSLDLTGLLRMAETSSCCNLLTVPSPGLPYGPPQSLCLSETNSGCQTPVLSMDAPTSDDEDGGVTPCLGVIQQGIEFEELD
jgi:hypothetical protein